MSDMRAVLPAPLSGKSLEVAVTEAGVERGLMRITDLGDGDFLVKAVSRSRDNQDLILQERVLTVEVEWWNPWAIVHAAISTFSDTYMTGDFGDTQTAR